MAEQEQPQPGPETLPEPEQVQDPYAPHCSDPRKRPFREQPMMSVQESYRDKHNLAGSCGPGTNCCQLRAVFNQRR